MLEVWADGLATSARSASEAIAKSAAHKLLIPTRGEKWEWVGSTSNTSTLIEQTLTAVKQIVTGEEVKATSAGTIVLSVIAGLFALWLLLVFVLTIVDQWF